MIKTYCLRACFLALPTVAAAQAVEQSVPKEPSRWSLGVGIGASDSPYAGERTRVLPLPLIQYEGERFFFRGLTGGAHLIRNEGFSLDAIASFRPDGIDAKDFGRTELSRNGINRDLLDDRDDGLDLGLVATWRNTYGKFELGAKADVASASKGYELFASYGYDFRVGPGYLTPSVRVSYLSKDLSNYYYGTLNSEVARGVVDYKPGAAVVPEIGLSYMRPVGQNWRMFGGVQYKFLPSKLSNSPLLESKSNGEASVRFGLVRSF